MGDCRCVESQAGATAARPGMVSAGSGGRPPAPLICISICILYLYFVFEVSDTELNLFICFCTSFHDNI